MWAQFWTRYVWGAWLTRKKPNRQVCGSGVQGRGLREWYRFGICHAGWSCECYSGHWYFVQISVGSLLHFLFFGQPPHPSFRMVLYLVAWTCGGLPSGTAADLSAGWLFQCPWADLRQWPNGTGVQKLISLASNWGKLWGIICPSKLGPKLHLCLVCSYFLSCFPSVSLVSLGSTSLMNHLHTNSHLRVSFWRCVPEIWCE